jgi:hypothetical protein
MTDIPKSGTEDPGSSMTTGGIGGETGTSLIMVTGFSITTGGMAAGGGGDGAERSGEAAAIAQLPQTVSPIAKSMLQRVGMGPTPRRCI